tara:strand:- start:24671 stop:25357 length:687 start_codon:yes stop_codon:yes gene_type:complete
MRLNLTPNVNNFLFLFSIPILVNNMKNKTLKKRSKKFNTIKKRIRKKRVFTLKDYSSGDGMLTSVWGPSMWHYLHTMSFNYPVKPTHQEKRHYMDFVKSLKYTLPCKYCRKNLVTNFKSMPLTLKEMKNRDSFSRYIYGLHELVNKMLGKKSGLTYCQVRERYEHFRARCTIDKPKIFKVIKNKTRKKKEKGCTEPLYGKKSKCVLKIVPQSQKTVSFQMDDDVLKKR